MLYNFLEVSIFWWIIHVTLHGLKFIKKNYHRGGPSTQEGMIFKLRGQSLNLPEPKEQRPQWGLGSSTSIALGLLKYCYMLVPSNQGIHKPTQEIFYGMMHYYQVWPLCNFIQDGKYVWLTKADQSKYSTHVDLEISWGKVWYLTFLDEISRNLAINLST